MAVSHNKSVYQTWLLHISKTYVAIKTISHNDTCKGSERSAPELGGGGLMFTRSALKYGGQIKYMQITSSRGTNVNITNGLTLSTEDLFSTFQYVGTLNIYFLVHFKKWYP